jgi:putative endopeptidase
MVLVPVVAFAEENDLAGYSDLFLDRTQDPCTDFYAYACGGWLKSHPIPADRSAWDRYYQLEEASNAAIHQILEDAKVKGKSRVEKQIGAYYSACTDEAAIEKKGLAALSAELKAIAAVKDLKSLAREAAKLQSFGAQALFNFYSRQDWQDASQVIAFVDQGGVAMGNPSDYLDQDARTLEKQDRYRKHVATMLRLAGSSSSEEQAAADAERVFKIEVALSRGAMSRKERRDPKNRNHKMTRSELEALAPSFPWGEYFKATGAPAFSALNVANPTFFKTLEPLLTSEDLVSWRAYLTWALLDVSAALLPKALAEADFDFYQRYQKGVNEAPPRWKRCSRLVNRDLGEAVGQLYVARYFPAERKQQMSKLVGRLKDAMEANLGTLDWMSEPTRQEALEKLRKMRTKIGNPEKWRDYSALVVSRDDALGNYFRGRQFDTKHQLAKIGKTFDREEWGVSPQVIDGYQSDERNEIGFTAGILQPPFVDATLGEAVILGEAGRMIGHEITHGFDDQGRKFDAKGELRDWWTKADAKAYEERAACFIEEYSRFVMVEELHVDGKLTLGENIADNSGLRLAYAALHGEPATVEDDQKFFLAFAQSQCANVLPKTLQVRVTSDPHSPAPARVNGTVQNMVEFQKAFSCKAGAAMAPVKRCRVW